MAKKTTSFWKTVPAQGGVLSSQIKAFGKAWLLAGDISRRSKATMTARRGLLGRLQWFLDREGVACCDTPRCACSSSTSWTGIPSRGTMGQPAQQSPHEAGNLRHL